MAAGGEDVFVLRLDDGVRMRGYGIVGREVVFPSRAGGGGGWKGGGGVHRPAVDLGEKDRQSAVARAGDVDVARVLRL